MCSKQFSQTWNLNLHIRVHTGEKPFECKVCSKQFGDSGSLTKHMKVHTGEKTIKCEKCSQSFTYKDAFKQHMLTHKEVSNTTFTELNKQNQGENIECLTHKCPEGQN